MIILARCAPKVCDSSFSDVGIVFSVPKCSLLVAESMRFRKKSEKEVRLLPMTIVLVSGFVLLLRLIVGYLNRILCYR